MKQIIATFIFLVLGLTSCESDKNSDSSNVYYVENMLSFYDPYDKDFDRSIWIRNSENIKVAHETFKKVGYRRLFLEYNYSYDWCWILGDVNKPCDEIIDSLLITHDSEKIRSKYYREFWDRRRTEQNDSIVFEVLKEVSIILCQDIAIPYNVDHVNDTLFKLIEIREFEDSLTDAKALENFNYLKSIGLYKSAYNLLFERYRYYDVEWNQEELKISLNSDTTNCCPWAFIEDSTK